VFGDPTMRDLSVPGRVVDPEIDAIMRRPDPGAAFATTINYSPLMVGVDFISTDNIGLESIIAEHVAFVESTPLQFNVGTGIAATMQWLAPDGVTVKAEIRYDNVAFGGGSAYGWSLNAVDRAAVIASPTVAPVGYPLAEMFLAAPAGSTGTASLAAAGSAGTASAQIALAANASYGDIDLGCFSGSYYARLFMRGAATQVNFFQVADTSSRFRFTTYADVPENSIDFIHGNLMFNDTTNWTLAGPGAAFNYFGIRAVAAAAEVGTAFAQGHHWRHVRADASGFTFVTPPSVTFSNILTTNANTIQMRALSPYGGQFSANAIATGVIECIQYVTVN
jgi:hypothetical protein